MMRKSTIMICATAVSAAVLSLSACSEAGSEQTGKPLLDTKADLAQLSVNDSELDDSSAKTLFNDRGCNACHETNEMRIGPPYRAVAARYSQAYKKNPGERIAALGMKIRAGGAGAWGNVPMVSNPAIPKAESERIARWILNLDPSGGN